MPEGVKLYIEKELGYKALRLSAYRNNMFVGFFTGYRNHVKKTVKCFPHSKIVPGIFSKKELVFECWFDDLEWSNRRGGNDDVGAQ